MGSSPRTHHQLGLAILFFASLARLSLSHASLPSEYSIIGHGQDPNGAVSDERAVELFRRWQAQHKKVYKHAGEAERRLENFKRNLRYVMERSRRDDGKRHGVGLNKFADLSNEEFRQLYLSKVKKSVNQKWRAKRESLMRNKRKGAESCKAPWSLDWRNYGIVTGVKDQGQCGSCWAFSSTGAIEGINALKSGDLISLSEQELVDCDTTNDGCDGGYMDYAFEWVINNGGIDSEEDYPYTSVFGEGGICNVTKEEHNKAVTIDGYVDVYPSEDGLLCTVIQQPISVGMDGSAIDFQLYTGGIYDGSCSANPNDIDHAVLIVGYGSEGGEDYWIVKNSWGTDWGVEGYFLIRRNADLPFGVCAINAMASYPTKESSAPSPYPSPVVPPPPPPPVTPPPPPPPKPTPPPPSPPPSECGDYSYCPGDETCCCLYEFYNLCLVYGCCPYQNAVCCTGTDDCCPGDYPICDIEEGLCLRNAGDYLGVASKKRKMAKRKLPWNRFEENKNKIYQPLVWKRNRLAAIR